MEGCSRRSFLGMSVASLVALGMSRGAQAQAPGVASGLLEFEGAVNWSAVARTWVAQRPMWIAAVRGATSVQQLAAQVLRLEAAMGWSSVQNSWRTRRAGWVVEVQGTTNDHQLAVLVMELEAVTKWSAVSDGWRGARDAWVARMGRI